ncbi:hypothetical protein, partial [Streptomyces sp. NPDC056785]|uniref:hypothetical protein n=1 Tax=Streptomyces sp. NPDC056785 TaxID=3345944 RepID=UPI0036A434EF
LYARLEFPGGRQQPGRPTGRGLGAAFFTPGFDTGTAVRRWAGAALRECLTGVILWKLMGFSFFTAGEFPVPFALFAFDMENTTAPRTRNSPIPLRPR